VACVSLAGVTAKVIGWPQENPRVVWIDVNLVQICAKDESIRSSRSGCVAPQVCAADPSIQSDRFGCADRLRQPARG
jgi:hypothetical protein